MKAHLVIAVYFILLLVSTCSREAHRATDLVTPCDVPVSRDLQEASFVVTYRFDVNTDGKPINVNKVKNDYLPDQPFASCISTWDLPSLSGEGTATFFRKPAQGGWTEVVVAGKGFNRSYRYDGR
jgi:hypothetical protein